MANKIYGSVNGTAHKARKIYGEVNGKARRIKKAYIGVNGIAQKIFTSAAAFSYSPADGMQISGNLEGKWELAFTKSGTLTVSSTNADTVQGFAVGGGQTAADQSFRAIPSNRPQRNIWTGGRSGNGGKVYAGNMALTEGTYTVHIGAAGEDSYIKKGGTTVFSSASGSVKAYGGNPADYDDYGSGKTAPGNGKDGVLAFNGDDCFSFPGRRFGASAGGGPAGTTDLSGNNRLTQGGKSGETGAGSPGSVEWVNWSGYQEAYINPGRKGADNTGSGGGAPLGKGGTGILLLRN